MRWFSMTDTITGTLTDYALMDEGQFAGFYGARIDDKPYVVMHHVDSFLLRLTKGESVEANLNKDGHISKIQRRKSAPANHAETTQTFEEIAKEQQDYNAKAKSYGFVEPTPGPAKTEAQKNIDRANAEGDQRMADNAAYLKGLTAGKNQDTCTSPEEPAKITDDGIARIVEETHRRNAAQAPAPAVQLVPVHPAPLTYSEDEMLLLRNVIAKGCTEPEFKLLMYMAKTYGLDPLLKQIWAVKRNESQPALIFAGRDGMLAIAHRSGVFDGMQSGVKYEGEGKDKKPVSAWCEVWRKDMSHSFKTEVPFSEYNTGFSVWKTNPSAMILKVAEAVCLRKAFSVSGLYAPEEIDMGV